MRDPYRCSGIGYLIMAYPAAASAEMVTVYSETQFRSFCSHRPCDRGIGLYTHIINYP